MVKTGILEKQTMFLANSLKSLLTKGAVMVISHHLKLDQENI